MGRYEREVEAAAEIPEGGKDRRRRMEEKRHEGRKRAHTPVTSRADD